jgi:hypothetical protein
MTETTLKPTTFPSILSFDGAIYDDFRARLDGPDNFVKQQLFDATMDGNYLKVSDPTHILSGAPYILNARPCFPELGYILTFEQKMRFSLGPSGDIDPFLAWAVYGGEEEYCGYYFIGGVSPHPTIYSYGNVSHVDHTSFPTFSANHIYQFKAIYTPGATRNDNSTIDLYVDDVLISTYTMNPFVEPLNVWLGGRIGGTDIVMDIGKLTVTAA